MIMKKRKYRQAAACFLTAALVLSAGPVQSVLAETEASSETIQQEIPEESTVTVTPGTEVSEETEPQTVPLTEQNTETETEPQTEPETETETTVETETETTEVETEVFTEEPTNPEETETETEVPETSSAQTESAPTLQANQLLEFSDSGDEAVKSVQEQIDSLPTADELAGMEREAQQKVYNQLQTAYDAYEALNEEQKAQIKGAEIFDSLFEVFNGMTNALEAAGAFEVTGGISGTDYSYTNGVLTVYSGANIIISMANGATTPTSDRIVVAESAAATITLAGVNITGPANDSISGASAQSAIDIGNNAHLILNLSDNTNNTLTGGNGNSGGSGASGIHVPVSASLAVCGSGNLSVTGGNSNATYGGSGIGGNPSLYGNTIGETCGTVIILATGSVIITGGSSMMSSSDGIDIGGGKGTSDGGNGQGIRPSSDGSYTVWGNPIVPSGVAFPDDITLDIPSGTTLNLPDTFTWPENITVTGGGTIAPDTMKVPAKITFKENLSKTATGNKIELVKGEDYTYNGNGDVSIKWFDDINGGKGNQKYGAPEGNRYFWVEVSAEETAFYKAASEDIRIKVAKGTRDTPTAPTTLEPKAGSITVNTVSGQKYICTTDSTAPAFDAAGWIAGNGSTYTFGNLSSDKQYYVYTYAPENEYFVQSGISEAADPKTRSAAYMVTIPAKPQTMTAGDENSTLHIAIDQNETFDIGYGGKVTVSAPAEVTLTGQEEYIKNVTLTSSLLVDGEEHQGNEIISFDQDNYTTQSAVIRFAKPVLSGGGIIPAGTYEGNIIFTVSYSEDATS